MGAEQGRPRTVGGYLRWVERQHAVVRACIAQGGTDIGHAGAQGTGTRVNLLTALRWAGHAHTCSQL